METKAPLQRSPLGNILILLSRARQQAFLRNCCALHQTGNKYFAFKSLRPLHLTGFLPANSRFQDYSPGALLCLPLSPNLPATRRPISPNRALARDFNSRNWL